MISANSQIMSRLSILKRLLNFYFLSFCGVIYQNLLHRRGLYTILLHQRRLMSTVTFVKVSPVHILNAVRCPYLMISANSQRMTILKRPLNVYFSAFVRNGGRGQLSSEWRHNENDVIMRTGAASAASAVGAKRHYENDVTMTKVGLWRYADWRHVTTGCTALVST